MIQIHFLISNRDSLPAFRFLGHSFVDRDFIAGESAAKRFVAEIGPIPFGQDGAYCHLKSLPDGTTEIGTDGKGYFHLFAYRSGNNWAIGSSFAQLVDFARENNLPINANLGSLYSWAASPDLVRTVMAFDTSVREITLLPSHSYFQISAGVLTQHDIPEQAETGTYRERLRDALILTRDRVATLLSCNDLSIDSHITGGMDSRVIFSILSGTPLAEFTKHPGRLNYFSQTNRALDLAVAKNVATARNVDLNPTQDVPAGRLPLSGELAYTYWRDAHLGSYAHILFPHVDRRNAKAVLPGLAGETLRHVYKAPVLQMPIERVVARQSKKFRDPSLFEDWAQGLRDADAILQARPNSHFSAMVRNHREFRDRFHTGHSMFWQIVVPPLASHAFVAASNALNAINFLEGKLLYDVLNSCGPDLLTIPFDNPQKMPSAEMISKLITIEHQPPAVAGRAYISADTDALQSVDDDALKPMDRLAAAVSSAAASSTVRSFLGQPFLQAAQQAIQTAQQDGARNLHGRGRAAHAAVLAKLVLG
jgi:hypothetical protein